MEEKLILSMLDFPDLNKKVAACQPKYRKTRYLPWNSFCHCRMSPPVCQIIKAIAKSFADCSRVSPPLC
uniref:Heterogeneous nuclear ribonucleoprotein A0 n=1 Tax=Nothobranchius kuhntae TaxID=321403 RepID=A0A1A8J3M5_NOTKU